MTFLPLPLTLPRHASGLLAAIAVLCASGAQAQGQANAVLVWNQALLAEVRLSRLGPPVVARALAVAHTCMYDAWAPFDADAVPSTAMPPRRPITAPMPQGSRADRSMDNKTRAVHHAAYRCLLNLFPSGAERLAAVLQAQGIDPAQAATEPTLAALIGRNAADAVIASRRHDGSNQYGDLAPGAYADYTGYTPRNAPMPFCLPATPGPCNIQVADPYHWQPLINDRGVLQVAVAPHWDRVRPFALASATQFDHLPGPADGPRYMAGPANYQADMEDMLGYSRRLTEAQKLIVEYWADGPESELPPGHWALFAQHVSQRDRHSLDEDVAMFFALANAQLDAGILAWHMKRKFDGVRPITSIRYFRQGVPLLAWGGPGRPVETIDGGKWTPYNPGSNLSPSFQGYVSGHSTFSAASAVALRSFTGSDRFQYRTTVPANFGRVEPGVPLVPTVVAYDSFTAAVDEAGLSRLYAGIHYADDNTDGQLLGRLAGQAAWDKAQRMLGGDLPLLQLPPGSDVVCADARLDARHYQSVTVPEGARCLLQGTEVRGLLRVGERGALTASGVVLGGSLWVREGSRLQWRGGRIGGWVVADEPASLSLAGAQVEGSVRIDDTDGALRLRDLRIAGDLLLHENEGGVRLDYNRVAGRLACSENQPAPTGAGNQASQRQGQCAAL